MPKEHGMSSSPHYWLGYRRGGRAGDVARAWKWSSERGITKNYNVQHRIVALSVLLTNFSLSLTKCYEAQKKNFYIKNYTSYENAFPHVSISLTEATITSIEVIFFVPDIMKIFSTTFAKWKSFSSPPEKSWDDGASNPSTKCFLSLGSMIEILWEFSSTKVLSKTR